MQQHKLLRVLPCQAGVDPVAITRFIDAVEEQNLGLHSLMLLRHNKVVAEGWWAPYRSDYNHFLFSLSKSFTSTAVGFAVQERRLTLDDDVLGFFPGKLAAPPCENMRKMKVRHLLGMCTGHTVEPKMGASDDWAYDFLTSYVPLEPGSKFLYNTFATYMLSVIVQNVTGQRVSAYLTPRLLEPLGIENVWWETCPKGYDTGGYGFHVKTEDIAKFGTFLLNRGACDGRQLLDAAWIDEATAWHIYNGPSQNPDWEQGYGYQFWRCQPEGVYRGDGAFGQYCIVMPRQDAVLAVQSGMDDMQPMLTLVWDILLPAMRDGDIDCPKPVQEQLKKRLTQLTLPLPAGESPAQHACAREASGKTYRVVDNAFGISRIRFDFGDTTTLHLVVDGRELAIRLGYQQWLDTPIDANVPSMEAGRPFFGDVACAGAWRQDAYTFQAAYTRTPFIDTFTATFSPGALVLSGSRNVGFSRQNIALCGIAE
ncbi:MAG: serine hydrolase [Eubacteriales bacterium]|nr:serine hydrolase [Eubacteriales bacterium]